MAPVTALRLHGKEQIQLDTIEPVKCAEDEVRLQIAFCGICGSDIHEYLSTPIFAPPAGHAYPNTNVRLPVVMGHEFSGTIVEIGSKVTGFKIGQEVCVNPSLDDRHFALANCSRCDQGRPNLCKRWATYGLNAVGGGFSDEIVVKHYNCLALPEGVSLQLGALAEPLAVAWHCIRISGFKSGQTVLIMGAGPIGLAILLLLQVWGASKIVITEVTDQRTALAKEFGADMVINPLQKVKGADGEERDPVLSAIHSFGPDGVDVAFDATGLQSTLNTGLAAVRPGGVFFNVAIHEKPLSLNLNDIALLEKKILGGICYTREDFEQVLLAMASGKIPFERMITAVVPLSDVVQGGFMELMNNKAKHVKILIQPDKQILVN